MEREQLSRKSFISRVDSFFKSEETWLASLVQKLNSQKGEEYSNSESKRVLDLIVGTPLAVGTSPLIIILGLAKMIEDGGTPFFIQDRENGLEKGEKVKIVKIRTMKPDSDLGVENPAVVDNGTDESDSRITKLGLIIRKLHLDELPQLWQVVFGQLSLIGPRSAPEYDFVYLREVWGDEIFEEWEAMYRSIPQGLSGSWQVYNKGEGKLKKRFLHEMFYHENASLGLDLYLVWRTMLRMLGG